MKTKIKRTNPRNATSARCVFGSQMARKHPHLSVSDQALRLKTEGKR